MNASVSSIASCIRRSSILDLYRLWQLERACFSKDAYGILSLLNLSIAPDIVRLKAISERQLVGFVAMEFQPFDRANWIITIAVSPHFEGRGIGHTLLSSAEQLHDPHADRMKLTVRRSNERAISMYTHCGYRWTGTYRRYYHDGEDGLVMEKHWHNAESAVY